MRNKLPLEEAIKMLDELVELVGEEKGEYYVQLSEWLKELKAYKNAPTIEPKWIPCEERLPDEDVDDSYLIAWTPADEEVKCGLPHYYQIADWEDGDWANIDYCGHDCIVILAWMPLPEPWKGADDE